jgi:hypothetical protein
VREERRGPARRSTMPKWERAPAAAEIASTAKPKSADRRPAQGDCSTDGDTSGDEARAACAEREPTFIGH